MEVMAGGTWAPEKNIYFPLPPDTFLDPQGTCGASEE